MLQAAITDLFNPLAPKAHNIKCQNILFPVQIKPLKSVKVSPSVKAIWRIFISCTLGSNGLTLRSRLPPCLDVFS